MGQTYKKFVKHVYDDERDEKSRKAAGKRCHSRFHESEEVDIEELRDDPLYDQYESYLKKLK
jgi:hypothetical protein